MKVRSNVRSRWFAGVALMAVVTTASCVPEPTTPGEPGSTTPTTTPPPNPWATATVRLANRNRLVEMNPGRGRSAVRPLASRDLETHQGP